MAAHYQHMLYLSKAQGLKDIAAKCSVTLLKYVKLLRPENTFVKPEVDFFQFRNRVRVMFRL